MRPRNRCENPAVNTRVSKEVSQSGPGTDDEFEPAATDRNRAAQGGPSRRGTFGKGVCQVHGGASSPDGRWMVYMRNFDRGNLSVIDNYR
jgi:hypothetical protein